MLSQALVSVAIGLFMSGFKGVAPRVEARLKGDAVKKTLEAALSRAVSNYAQGDRLVIARALLVEDGLLTDSDVIDELRTLVSFERPPNYKLIARKWKSLSQLSTEKFDYEGQSQLFLSLFEAALRDTDVFRPVFESKDIQYLAETTVGLSTNAQFIENDLHQVLRLLESELIPLYQKFLQTQSGIQNEIVYDFSDYIALKTDSFVGRIHVFDTVNDFINNRDNKSGYFFIQGDPGSGKSAIMAELVLRSGYVHHFNIRSDVNSKRAFLRNICAQLIAKFDLDHTDLPINTEDVSLLFKELLKNVSAKMQATQKNCVLVIDALDEINPADIDGATNPLGLPQTLPDGIFVIASRRRDQQPFIRIAPQTPTGTYTLQQDDSRDQSDIDQFIVQRSKRSKVQDFIAAQKRSDANEFVSTLSAKSQGNFIYTRLVLDDIERGRYRGYEFSELPQGLENYYQDHWQRIKEAGRQDWIDSKLPVILALTVAKEPISVGQMSDYAGVETEAPSKRMIRTVLNDFSQFLYERYFHSPDDQHRAEKLYRWYHASFFEFIERKDEIEEGVSLARAARREFQMMQSQMGDFFDE